MALRGEVKMPYIWLFCLKQIFLCTPVILSVSAALPIYEWQVRLRSSGHDNEMQSIPAPNLCAQYIRRWLPREYCANLRYTSDTLFRGCAKHDYDQ
ncbi:hypothetical protein BKA82DRAFT_970456 [Pisolithus tinctorius]|uniref:Uncharacterized protein n=1 Tax=Pisolithus tinctorius Marx 270 TaxID=870435 RepID=A0A0C3N9J1_PISTI|nr:hypothetical protein BKA82DRAFT_970456 [Pisolithus tinctorius]KIN97739.1 hypothetical protein M404DRAFT_970456 [Pisolithus tinctorius Marx 270]